MLSTASVSAQTPIPSRSSPSHRPSQQSSTSTSTTAAREDILRLIAECDATLEREPQCLHTRAVRGHACMKAKLWDRAIADFGLILSSRPDDVHGRFSRGMALFKSGRVEDAHADFSRVLELNPHHVMARYARAGCYNTEGKFHHAIQDYTIALEHDDKEHGVVVGGRHGLRGWHHEAEKVVNEKLSGSDVVRKSRRGASGSGDSEPLQRRASMAESLGRPKVEDDELRRASVAIVTQPPSTSNTTVTKKPRKVVQVKLDLGVASQPASAPVAAQVDMYEKRSSQRCVSPRSNSRLRLERVPASPPTTNQQQLRAETTARNPILSSVSSEPPPCVESSRAVPAASAPRILAQPQPMQARETDPMAPRQPTKRAVRRVTIAL